jgi:hypothetical protein
LAVLFQSTSTNLGSKGLSTYDQKVARRDQRHQSIEKDKITVNKKKTKKQGEAQFINIEHRKL